MKLSFVLLGLSLCVSVLSFSQSNYNAELLIPYNDHGKWGYSDTLGNVKVEPEFESASFFFNSNNSMISRVKRGEKSVHYVLNKGCVEPIGYDAEYSLFRSFFLENSISIIWKSNKVGLFNYEKQKILIDAEYKKTTIDEENGMIYFWRYEEKGEGMSILAYDVNTQKQKKLNYVEIRTEGVRSGGEMEEYIIFRDKRNRWFEFDDGEFFRFPYDDIDFIEGYEQDDGTRTAVAAPEMPKKLFNEVPSYRTDKIEGATLHSSIELGNYRMFQVMWKDGSFGLYQRSTQLLSFNYDFIDIDYEFGFFYLLQDKKMGVYLPGTTYPTIQPKYDLLSFYKKLKVSDNWVFVLFNAKMNGSDGYVGENGVEFFNFD